MSLQQQITEKSEITVVLTGYLICGRCGGKLKAKTFEKYNGYSRQCLAKIRAEKSVPEVKSETEIDRNELNYQLGKTRVSFPKYYYRTEYEYIYGIPKGTDKYYDNYLSKVFDTLYEAVDSI